MATTPARHPLPLGTPVSKFGLPASQMEKLTPAARRITKRDLLLLDGGRPSPAARNLTTQDLSSLRNVFGARNLRLAGGADGATACCSCSCSYFCCCCTAVAVTKPRVD